MVLEKGLLAGRYDISGGLRHQWTWFCELLITYIKRIINISKDRLHPAGGGDDLDLRAFGRFAGSETVTKAISRKNDRQR